MLKTLIEIIFPTFCVNCGKKNTLLCSNCYEQIEFCSFDFSNLKYMKYIDEVISVCKYEGVIKKLIFEFKYKSVINIRKTIAHLIYRSTNIPECDLLIPVPIHKNKRMKRGFNQSEQITKKLSKLIKIPTVNLLIKTKETKSQMSVNKKNKRKTNLKNSITINKKILAEYSKQKINIILVDDVVTTGATLDECAKILKENGVKKVTGLTLARQ